MSNLPVKYQGLKVECARCKEKFEEVFIKNKYNGNDDDNQYCKHCYIHVHGDWDWYGETEFEVREGKNEYYRARGTVQ